MKLIIQCNKGIKYAIIASCYFINVFVHAFDMEKFLNSFDHTEDENCSRSRRAIRVGFRSLESISSAGAGYALSAMATNAHSSDVFEYGLCVAVPVLSAVVPNLFNRSLLAGTMFGITARDPEMGVKFALTAVAAYAATRVWSALINSFNEVPINQNKISLRGRQLLQIRR